MNAVSYLHLMSTPKVKFYWNALVILIVGTSLEKLQFLCTKCLTKYSNKIKYVTMFKNVAICFKITLFDTELTF